GANPVKLEDVRLTLPQKNELSRQARYNVVSNITQRLCVALRQQISLTYRNLLKHYTNQLALHFPILLNLTNGQIARLQEQANNPRGLDLEVQPMRLYPFGPTAAHVLGVLRRERGSAAEG